MSDEPRGVKTNGIGQKTTAHLNLTRTMADVIAEESKRSVVYPRYYNNRFLAKSRKQER